MKTAYFVIFMYVFQSLYGILEMLIIEKILVSSFVKTFPNVYCTYAQGGQYIYDTA